MDSEVDRPTVRAHRAGRLADVGSEVLARHHAGSGSQAHDRLCTFPALEDGRPWSRDIGEPHAAVVTRGKAEVAVETQASRIERNKTVIRRFVEEVQNKKDFGVYDELTDPEFVNLSAPPGVPADAKGGRVWLSTFAEAYPDSEFAIDDMIGEGDRVVTKKTLSGTHTGEFGGIPATGKRVTLQYVDIMRVRDGRIVEHWASMDQLSWLRQLGVIPG